MMRDFVYGWCVSGNWGARSSAMAALVIFALSVASCQSFDDLVLQNVPAEVLAVRNDPDAFPPNDHPLKDVDSGMVIDAPSQLAGFWGNVRTRMSEDSNTGTIRMVQIFTVLKFDLDNAELEQQIIQNSDGGEFVIVKKWDLEFLSDNRYRQTFASAKIARLTDDEQAAFDLLGTFLADIDTGVSFETLFTVDGNFMRTLDGGIGSSPEDIIAAGNEDGQTTLWVRLPS